MPPSDGRGDDAAVKTRGVLPSHIQASLHGFHLFGFSEHAS